MIKRSFLGLATPKLQYNSTLDSVQDLPVPSTVTLLLKEPKNGGSANGLKVGDGVKTGQRLAASPDSAEYVISSLKEVAERCMTAVPVEAWDSDAKCMMPTGEWKFEHSGANKSLELLGKHLGLFTDKTETTHSFDLSGLSDEELNAIASGKPIS